MEYGFLLSIIIPTKNRCNFIIKAVEQILQMNEYRIQVIIQDNSDTQELSEMLSAYKDDVRLKYNYTEDIISFVDNFSLAVMLAEGEYVCIIGDDDGVVPQIIDVTEWASNNNIDAVRPELNAVYFWPNSKAVGRKTDNGYMSINKITAKSRLCNPIAEVVKLLNQGGQKYLSLDMVKLYHGIVKRECLEKIKRQTGAYFGGLSPDIYIAVALSLTANKVVAIDFPLTISGICNKSGSADSATGKHTGRLEDAPHLRGHDKYKWSDLVPKFYSVETIWADSALAAIKDLNELEMYKEFNVTGLTAYCLKKYPQFKDIIMLHYNICSKTAGNSKSELIFANIKDTTADCIKKGIRKIKRGRGHLVQIYGIENIIKAEDVLKQRFKDIGINTEMVITSLNEVLKKL